MGRFIFTFSLFLSTCYCSAQNTCRDSLIHKYFDYKSRVYGDDIDVNAVNRLRKNETTFIVDSCYEYIRKEVVLNPDARFIFKLNMNTFQAQFDTLTVKYSVACYYDDSDQSDITLVMEMRDDSGKEAFSYDLFYLDDTYMILRESWRTGKKKSRAKRIILLQLDGQRP